MDAFLVSVIALDGYDRRSMADVGRLVGDAIRHYQKSIPESAVSASHDGACRYAIGQVMRLTRGQANPEVVRSIVHMERLAWDPRTAMPC